MLEERFYGAALFFLYLIKAFRFGIIHHGLNPLEGSGFGALRRLGNGLLRFGMGLSRRQALGRSRRGLFHGRIDFVSDFARSLLEFADALSEAFGELRQLLRAEENEDHRQDQDHFPAAKPKDT